MIYSTWHFPIYKLRPLPGAFTEEDHLPTMITWVPTKEEENEGPWEIVGTKKIVTELMDLRDLVVQQPKEPFTELVDGLQDDSGVVMLMQDRASRARSSASRSHSQPPYMRNRNIANCAVQESSIHWWLGTYHRCPFDSRWHLDCVSEVDECYRVTRQWRHGVQWDYNHVRNCARGISDGPFIVQESESWYWHSFLPFVSSPSRKYQSESLLSGHGKA